jgi:hypothetical protein
MTMVNGSAQHRAEPTLEIDEQTRCRCFAVGRENALVKTNEFDVRTANPACDIQAAAGGPRRRRKKRRETKKAGVSLAKPATEPTRLFV